MKEESAASVVKVIREKVTNGDAQSWWEPFGKKREFQSTSHENGTKKGYQYGGNLLERREIVSKYRPRKWNRKRLPIWWEPFGKKRDSFQVPTTKMEPEKVANGDAHSWCIPFCMTTAAITEITVIQEVIL